MPLYLHILTLWPLSSFWTGPPEDMLVFILSEGRDCTAAVLRTESAGEMVNERKAHTLVNFHSGNWEYEKPVPPWMNYRCQISVLRFWRAGASFVSCLDERDLIYGTKSWSGWQSICPHITLLTVTSMTDIINCLRCPVALSKQAGFPNHEIWNLHHPSAGNCTILCFVA